MTTDLLRDLAATAFPEATLMREAMREAGALAPAIVETIELAAGGVVLIPSQENLLFNGTAALAGARRTEPYRPILRLARLPAATLDFLLGDGPQEWICRVVLSTFDGDAVPLTEAVMDPAIDGLVRSGLGAALARLAFDGAVPRELVLATIDRFEAERAGGTDTAAWMAWASMNLLLGRRDRIERIRAAWQDGRIAESEETLAAWLEDLEAAAASPDDPTPFEAEGAVAVDDPMDMVAAPDDAAPLAEVSEAEERSADPAADTALTPAEEAWLALFLTSAHVPPGTMSLERLDGFMSGLINGPTRAKLAPYLPLIWDRTGAAQPTFASAAQEQHLLTLVDRQWRTIEARAARHVAHHAPIVAEAPDRIGRDWAVGFRAAVGLHLEAWQPLMEDPEFVRLLLVVMALETESLEKIFPKGEAPSRLELVEGLPLAVIGIGAFWAERRADDGRPVRTARPKTGRDAPCPCGSGKAFKDCCGKA